MNKRPDDMAPTPTVAGVTRLNITGNIIAPAWYSTITLPNGRPDFYAIMILADFIYWYKATPVYHPRTQVFMGWERKFYGDKLQANYKTIAGKFNMPVKLTREAIYRLIDLGVLIRELRTVVLKDGAKLTNVPYWDINLEVLDALTYPPAYPVGALVRADAVDPASLADQDTDQDNDQGGDPLSLAPHVPVERYTLSPYTGRGYTSPQVEGVPAGGYTYTETTTEISTKISNPNSALGFSSQTANDAGQVDAAEPATVANVNHARPTRAIAGSTDRAQAIVGDPLQGAVSQDSPQDIDARVAELLDAADDPAGVAQDPQQLADIQAYHQQLADTVSRGRSGLAPDASNEFTHSWLAIISTTPPAAGSLQTAGTVSRQVPGTGNVPKVAPAPPQAPTGRRDGYSGIDTPYVAPQAPRKAGKGAGKQEKW